MTVSTYEFSNKEDRETAFNNIVKWYGPTVVKKIEILDLNVEASAEISTEAHKIIEKHCGSLKVETVARV
ncbi:hypothetical protein D3C87_1469200 [compost metagenome]